MHPKIDGPFAVCERDANRRGRIGMAAHVFARMIHPVGSAAYIALRRSIVRALISERGYVAFGRVDGACCIRAVNSAWGVTDYAYFSDALSYLECLTLYVDAVRAVNEFFA
jgi:hypothetical protein